VAGSVKLLVVDDDAGSLAALADILSMEGYLVETVANGREALDHLRAVAAPPALIILDLFMPVMDGWQFLAEMKTDSKLSEFGIPVIVITALNAKVEEADAIIRKPVDLVRLLQTVTRLLGNASNRSATS
jgi:CheY-like chemotaxis protein